MNDEKNSEQYEEESSRLDEILDKIFNWFHLVWRSFLENITMVLITFTGALFIATVNIHIRAIITISSQISGFYLFAFTMLSILDIFASLTFNKNKTLLKLILCSIISGLLCLVIILFVREFQTEVNDGTAALTRNMILSKIILYFGFGCTLIGVLAGWIQFILRRVGHER